MTSQTIKYNVGGKLYELSKDIINRHPDSMLARIASDTWNGKESATERSDEKPKETEGAFFINGNSERFQYCVDYLVHGKVTLPKHVPKQALLDDLNYYCIDGVDVECILESAVLVYNTIDSHNKWYKKAVVQYDLDVEIAAAKRLFFKLAHYCFEEHYKNQRIEFRFNTSNTIFVRSDEYSINIKNSSQYPSDETLVAENSIFVKYKHMFDEYLIEYGFRCADIKNATMRWFRIEIVNNAEPPTE